MRLIPIPREARHLLDDGEEILTWETAQPALGEDRRGKTGRPRVVAKVHWNLFRYLNPLNWDSPPIEFEDGVAARWVGGVMVAGEAHGLAATLHDAFATTEPGAAVMATSRRLLVASSAIGRDPAVVQSVSLAEVSDARWRPRPLMAGRIVVGFADGSRLALMCGMIFPFAARRLRQAIRSARSVTP
ncbi:MAG: hypothetical protein QM621_07500 [Aeromicrobium sp.]|uniref:hypothetical protein n=1 Tax=Aeromicrobium sp. TaxID=1871063 RepID=UPI0039E55C49